jgi:ABC-type nitrate/sulfonate/bicarbonate transport system substrate-binding protein
MRRTVTAIAGATVAALAAAALAACGSGTAATSSASTTTIKVGIGPVSDFGQLYVAQAEGYFTKAGLKIETTTVSSGPEGIAAVKGGSLDVTYSAALPLFLSAEQGLGLRFLGPGDEQGPGHWVSQLVVAAGSPYTTEAQVLAQGKKVGMIGSSSPDAIALDLKLAQMRVPVTSVPIVTLSVPDLLTALTSGEVNSSLPQGPFLPMGVANHSIRVVDPDFESILGNVVPTGGYVATASWINSNKTAVAAFDKALLEATQYINANPASAEAIINSAIKTPAAITKLVVFPEFVSRLSAASLQTQINQAHSVGILSTSISASSLFAQ